MAYKDSVKVVGEMEKNKVEILLVEDDSDAATLASLAFEKNKSIAPVKIHCAKDGVEALEYIFGAKEADGFLLSHHPQLILLDLKLPKMDGLDVLRKIKKHPEAKDIPVVVMTGSNDQTDWIESYSLGAECFLRKSINFNEFIEAAGWILAGAIEQKSL